MRINELFRRGAENSGGALATLLPVAAVLGSMASLSIGTSLAKHLFPLVGAQGTAALRVGIAALVLVAIWQPWRMRLSRTDLGGILLYGIVVGVMNLMFYAALRTIPVGVAIAIEFTGPLVVALASSRRFLDFLWIGVATVGLALLLPLGAVSSALDPVGVAFALGAAVCWALYIVSGQRLRHLHAGRTVALGVTVASAVVLPFGIAQAGAALLDPAVLPLALAVALLSSALPYSLEMFALQSLPKQIFGVLLSLEPAIGSLAGLAILGERLTSTEWLAIGCIVAASAGNTASAHRRRVARSAHRAPVSA